MHFEKSKPKEGNNLEQSPRNQRELHQGGSEAQGKEIAKNHHTFI